MKRVVAIDLGASNGCITLVTLQNNKLNYEEVYRFRNDIIEENGYLYWDIDRLFAEILRGIQKVDVEFHSIGIDTWGVDFGLIGDDGQLLQKPLSYRNTHTIDIMKAIHQRIDEQALFSLTGVESAPINTLYQLKAVLQQDKQLLQNTSSILTLPSLINCLLTGIKANEFTHASTTQMLSIETKDWNYSLMEDVLGMIPPLAPIAETNQIIGETKKEINDKIGRNYIPVVQVPGHDTACAVAAIPRISDNFAFMSCGTWVLIGAKVKEPVVSEKACEWGFTNEGTAEGTYRLQKNNMGLWILQQCKREWERQGEKVSFEEEYMLVEESEPFRSFIDPDHTSFFNPESMISAIQSFCRETNQAVPQTKGEIIRTILESLALKYRWVLNRIELLLDTKLPEIHMVGGGIQNLHFCQFTANATKKNVQTGPIEASSLGNALSQLIALKEIKDWNEARKISKKSFNVKEYLPTNVQAWENAYEHFKDILSKTIDYA